MGSKATQLYWICILIWRGRSLLGGAVMGRPQLKGSQKCDECHGKGEVNLGERHGETAYDECPVCMGRGVIPIIEFEDDKP